MAAGAGALVLASACSPRPATETRAESTAPRNVVLVVLDSVRADHVGAYGYTRATTPHLDALAAQGLLFERAYAASSFGPQALAALWTGRLPTRGGSIGTEARPHPELVTLPRLFRRAGFRTALVSNHAALRERAFTRGFDELEIDSVPGRWSGALVTKKALDLLDGAKRERLFLVLDFADAGEPHQPPEEFRRRIDVPAPEQPLTLQALRAEAGSLPEGIERSAGFQDLVARYDAEIAYADECLGQLVTGLAVRGLLDDTLLVVTASHGKELLEHDYVGSGWTLHEEVLRVPLVVCAPKRLASGRIAEPVSLVDLWPSLQQLFAPASRDLALDGRTLFDLVGPGLVPRVPTGEVLAELVLPELTILRASIRGSEKLVEVIQWAPPGERAALLASYEERLTRVQHGEMPRTEPRGPVQRRELYDLAADPHELCNLAGSALDRLATLAMLLERYAQNCRESGLMPDEIERQLEPVEAPELGELQQIGYL